MAEALGENNAAHWARAPSSRRFTSLIDRLLLTSPGGFKGIAGMIGLVLLAWAARAALDPALPPGFPYLTFFPAVVLTAVLFGVRLGAVSALLCGLIAWYFYIPPYNQFKMAGTEVALGLYVFVVTTELGLIYGVRAAMAQLRQERQTSLDLAAAQAQAAAALEERARELREALDALRDSEIKTHLATQTAGIGVWQWHVPSNTVHWDDTMFELYGVAPTPDGMLHVDDYLARLHPEDLPSRQQLDVLEAERETRAVTREFRIRRGEKGEIRHLRAVEVARTNAQGQIEWVVGTNLDITEQKNRESQIRLLLGEVNHRAKNLLAVVLSVARRTSGADHETFLRNFSARIHSLSAGQDLLVQTGWRGVGLHALIAAQVGHLKDLIGTRILLEGEDIALSASAVQTLGMTIHELVTNAGKYGALSAESGEVRLAWQRVPGPAGEEERFVMTWRESGGPAVVAPARRGFGSMVTGDMVRSSLDAEVESSFAPEGFTWRLECALGVIEEAEAA